MQNTDFPGLYQSADTLSANAQKYFLGALFSNLLLLVLAALVSVINYPHWVAALINSCFCCSRLPAPFFWLGKDLKSHGTQGEQLQNPSKL